MIYYDQDGIVVRTAKKEDVESLKDRLRESDVNEVWASHHHSPEEALKLSLDKSIFCLTIENGRPIGMFGINTENLLGDTATVWLLGSDDMDKIMLRFLRHSKHFIRQMLEYYPTLSNFVDSRNKKSIKWLKSCGAEIGDSVSYGEDGLPFMPFTFRRK